MKALFKIQGFMAYSIMIFLNAFIDLGHKIVIQNTVFKVYDGDTQIILTAIVNSLILLPFIFLFSPAGFISNRFPKHRVMQLCAVAAVFITLMITACYYMGWFWAAFAMTLLLAIQSAIYSPAKYGYIKNLVEAEQLTAGNGVVQALTTTGVLFGIFFYSFLFEKYLVAQQFNSSNEILVSIAPIGWILVFCTLIELVFAYCLPAQSEQKTAVNFDVKHYVTLNYLKNNIKIITKHKTIWLSIMAITVFWSISQTVLSVFPTFAKATLNETNTVVIQGILAATGIGLMFGSLLAGYCSRRHIELGLIPFSAVGLSISLALLPQLNSTITLAVDFLMIGIMGGLFIVPLNTLIQYHADDSTLGTVLAGNNWIQNIGMLFLLIITVVFTVVGISTVELLTFVSAVAMLGSIYTMYKLPHSLMRLVVGFVMKRKYRIEVLGFNNLPSKGGLLLLGNHISFIDFAIVQLACPRQLRFVMHRDIYNIWYLKPIFKLVGAIPIAKNSSKEALVTINALLKAGEAVCLFPEGAISHTGHLGQFKNGYERAVNDVGGVIVPFYLQGLWGSVFSRSSKKISENRSVGIKRDIFVAFGEPLAMTTTTDELKKKVFDLSITAWDEYTKAQDSISLAWLKMAKRMGFKQSVIDTRGETLSNYKLVAATMGFSKLIDKNSPEQNVGLLLPTSSASIIANMALMLRGKTVVNVNFTASKEAILSAVKQAELKTVYTSALFLKKLSKKGVDLNELEQQVQFVMLEDLKRQITIPVMIKNILMAIMLPAPWLYRIAGNKVSIDEPAAILFSSGSEGNPKGIVLSHRNIIANVKQVSDVLNTQKNDVVMSTLSMFHSFGMTVTGIMPLIEGIPVVCHPDPTDVVAVAKAISRQKATIMCGTSTFLRLYTKNSKVQPLMLESLRVVVAGAEKLSEEVKKGFEEKFHKTIYEGYGATETSPVASVNIPNKLNNVDWHLQKGSKDKTVGMPLPGTQFKIVDPHTLLEVPQGNDGMVLIAGPQVMLGYLNDKHKTADVIVRINGRRWYKTGDKGHIDEDGFLTIVDRYSRFAKIGGEMISLGAVEQQVENLFDDVKGDFVAINIPDAKKGEKVVLMMADDIDLSSVRQRMIEVNCNPLMIPSHVVKVNEIPALGSGKIDYVVAKQQAMALLCA